MLGKEATGCKTIGPFSPFVTGERIFGTDHGSCNACFVTDLVVVFENHPQGNVTNK